MKWLNYTDREVECFHPVCEEILNQALCRLGLTGSYKVEHHRMTGNLEMDFAISNTVTGRILCVIEVKRTTDAVQSSRCQLQAMCYVQELRPAEKEQDFYILTNLETVAFFRYSATRPNVVDQLLTPGIKTVRRFCDTTREEFIDRLSAYFAELIARILKDDSDYYLSFRHIVSELTDNGSRLPDKLGVWHSKFAALFYEYIRGALQPSGQNEMVDVRRLHYDITQICREALRVNFKAIFGLPQADYAALPAIPPSTLSEILHLGNPYLDADAISDILFNLIADKSPYPGAVSTDIELARALIAVASAFCDEPGNGTTFVDPAAGCGNLLSVIPQYFPGINPRQLVANDINPYLLQVLSLRLGLKFPQTVCPANSPSITSFDITDIPADYFSHAGLIVVNPPYLSHTSNAWNDYKSGIIRRIQAINGNALTRSEKSPLEAAFIELLATLAPVGCVIACIVPLSHLFGRGESGISFRRMLLKRFGLQCIFRYPQQNIFRSVAQNTCILIGRPHTQPEQVVHITSTDTIDNTDYSTLHKAATSASFTTDNGIERRSFPTSALANTICNGWKILDNLSANAYKFLKELLQSTGRFVHMSDANILNNNYRGRVGNCGGSDLIFPKPGSPFFNAVAHTIRPHLQTGLRTTTELKTPYISSTDTPFLDVSRMDAVSLNNVVTIYKEKYEAKQSRQLRLSKSVDDYIRLLHHESQLGVAPGAVLLPRDCRRYGRAYLAKTTIFASTNVWIFQLPDNRAGQFYHSWFCSVFYQLNCELVGKNHAGARKMDNAEFADSVVPDITAFTSEEIDEVCNCGVDAFIELSNPHERACDRLWAKLISPSHSKEYLADACRYLSLLANDREA